MDFDFVFVVLVYRNTNDLTDFFSTCTIPNSKVLVVNSFYDEESEAEFKRLSIQHGADFLSVENKGYGYGNNRGIEYALKNYTFQYLIISNADINILQMDINVLDDYPKGIYAPSIYTLSGKQQNPHMPFHISWMDKLKFKFFASNNWLVINILCALNKIFRLLFLSFIRYLNHSVIYSAHGSFVIVSRDIIDRLLPFYDENVFLFTEEENLAMNAKLHNISTFYIPKIKIQHKEDGSTSTISDRQKEITRNSYLTFYRKWYLNSKNL